MSFHFNNFAYFSLGYDKDAKIVELRSNNNLLYINYLNLINHFLGFAQIPIDIF